MTTTKKAPHWLDDDDTPAPRPDKPKKARRPLDISSPRDKKAIERMDLDPVRAVKRERLERDRGLVPKKVKKRPVEDEPRLKTRKELSRELVLPKKVKKSNLPALFVKPPQQRISKLTPNKMKSILGDSAEQIHQLLESDSNESASALLRKRLLQEVLDLIPLAVNGVRKTKGQRGVYQVNSLITSIREIMIDMQATQDKGAMGDSIVEKILRPAFMDIATELIKEDGIIANVVKSTTDNESFRRIEDAKNDSVKRLANMMQLKYEEAKEKMIACLMQ